MRRQPDQYIQRLFDLMRAGRVAGIIVTVHDFQKDDHHHVHSWAKWAKKPRRASRKR